MAILNPISLNKWINEHRHLLKPPVGNQQIYTLNEDFIVMVVGGPNARKDFHYNLGEELFYQLEGNIILTIIENGQMRDIHINEGDLFLLPPKVPHCPKRGSNTVGLVIERYRHSSEKDAFMWFCEKCNNLLHESHLHVSDIVNQLPIVMQSFYNSEELRTCKKCGTIMSPPIKI
ncbi:MAG: 3-hydroxyanthranilate 3,4-dioxygenase [Bacteroidota bacterium]|nr:3-hydroxyanthranilate 3,4-dioxygenase [Bacteroidota bacterium]